MSPQPILKTKIVSKADSLLEKRPWYDKLFYPSLGLFFGTVLLAGFIDDNYSWIITLIGLIGIVLFLAAIVLRFLEREMKNAQFTGVITFTEECIIANNDDLIAFTDMRNIRVSISGYKNKFKWNQRYKALFDAGLANYLYCDWNGAPHCAQFYLSRRKNAVLVHNLFVRLSRKKQIKFWSFLNYSDWLPR